MRALRNLNATMRDGARLATSVYPPDGDGPFPTVLCGRRTTAWAVRPGSASRDGLSPGLRRYDLRATGTFINEEQTASTRWRLRQQPWCDGRVHARDLYLAATCAYLALST